MHIYDPQAIANRIRSKLKHTDNGCLVFTGATNPYGYGTTYANGKYLATHRVMYEANVGPIPDGFVVCHKCDNPSCCNPEHLFTASQSDNLADMRSKRRHSKGKSHSEAIKRGWTDELREKRANQTRERMTREREQAAIAAGVPTDWKFCPECKTWHPRTNFHKNKARLDGIKPYCKTCATNKDMRRRAIRMGRKIPRPTPGS